MSRFLAGLLFVGVLFGQTDRGSLTGTVSDPASASVPSATVSVRNIETNAEYQTVATETGNYTIASLPAGQYELSVSSPGFSRFLQKGIRVQVAQTIRVDVVLQVGSTTESVTVTADAPLLRTEGADISTVVSRETVNALPLPRSNMRNPLDFATFAPGVTGNAGSAGSSSIRVNGAPETTYKVLVDGQDITSSIDQSHTLEQQPSIDALQEFVLQTSNFAAEYGQVAGGLFNLTTRSGTNQWHGGAYEYYRNEFLNAGRPYTDNGSGEHIRPKSRNYNTGANFGGPVIIPKLYDGRNRTFFFANMEYYRSRGESAGSYTTVPIDAYRRGDFSSALTGRVLGKDPLGRDILENQIFDPLTTRLVDGQLVRDPFPGNIIPANRIDPIAAKVQSLIPQPSRTGFINNFEMRYPGREDRDIPSIKIDHSFGVSSKLSFYYSRYRYDALARADGLPVPITGALDRRLKSHTYRLNFDQSVTPTFLVHAGFGFVRWTNKDVALQEVLDYDAATQLGLQGGVTTGMPRISVGVGAGNRGGLSGNPNSNALGAGNGAYQFNDKPTAVLSGTYVRGNHTFKAGGEWRQDVWAQRDILSAIGRWSFAAEQTAQPYLQSTNIGGGSVGFAYASFLLGGSDTAAVSNIVDPRWKKQAYGLYAQDTWKVTRRLTLDYGVRWDYQQAPSEVRKRMAMFGPTIPNPSAGGRLGGMVYEGNGEGRCNCSFTDTYPYAIGPRLGVAFQLNDKTVLRGGWGLSYGNPNNYNYISAGIGVGWNTLTFDSVAFGEPGAQFSNGLVYDPAELYRASYDPGLRPTPGQINSPPYYLDRNGGRPPRINQWNMSLQREITRDIVIEAAYVGNRGVWYQANSLIDLNALTPERIAGAGLDINNAGDRQLLTARVDSPVAAQRGFGTPPYSSFPRSLTVAQTLRPYPQYGNIPVRWAPLGSTWYDALQTKMTKRYSYGLTASVAYTWQKELVLGVDDQGGGFPAINDVFNRQNQKTISPESIPHVFTTTISYRTPKAGPNAWVRNVLGGWTVGALLRYQSGLPLRAPDAQNNLSQILFRSTYATRVPGQPLYLSDINGDFDPNKEFVLNPKAWADPAAGQFGQSAVYFNDYRARRSPEEQLSLGRVFEIKEGLRFEIRGEFFNAFNRLRLPNPSSGNALQTQVTTNGVPSAGFGFVNTTGGLGGARSGQLLGRITW